MQKSIIFCTLHDYSLLQYFLSRSTLVFPRLLFECDCFLFLIFSPNSRKKKIYIYIILRLYFSTVTKYFQLKKKICYIFYMRFIVTQPTFKTLWVDSYRIRLVKRNISAVNSSYLDDPQWCIMTQIFKLKLSGDKHTQGVIFSFIICSYISYHVISLQISEQQLCRR